MCLAGSQFSCCRHNSLLAAVCSEWLHLNSGCDVLYRLLSDRCSLPSADAMTAAVQRSFVQLQAEGLRPEHRCGVGWSMSRHVTLLLPVNLLLRCILVALLVPDVPAVQQRKGVDR
jgi:hypothetical protein